MEEDRRYIYGIMHFCEHEESTNLCFVSVGPHYEHSQRLQSTKQVASEDFYEKK